MHDLQQGLLGHGGLSNTGCSRRAPVSARSRLSPPGCE